ncbi:MAG: c-type cytochrome [Bacteroidota bacterium]
MKKLTNLISAIIIVSLFACGGSSEKSSSSSTKEEKPAAAETKASSGEDDIKLQQYVVAGKEIFKTYCLACHQAEGQGLAKLYPPLAKSDFLIANPDKAACGIRNGQFDPITVNGVQYNQVMPPIPTLTDLEIAEVLTYVSNSWGNEAGLIEVKQVTEWLNACKKN